MAPAVALEYASHHFMRCRSPLLSRYQVWGEQHRIFQGGVYSSATAGATPLSLKVHPLCLQYAELGCRVQGAGCRVQGAGTGLGKVTVETEDREEGRGDRPPCPPPPLPHVFMPFCHKFMYFCHNQQAVDYGWELLV